MHKPLSLRKNFVWAFFGNFIYAASQWGILMVLTKISTVEDVGTFGLATAISTPIIMFTNLQLVPLYVTDATRQYSFGEYLGLRLITVVIAVLTVVSIAIGGRYNLATVLLIIGWCIAQCAVSVKEVFLGVMQKHERMDKVSLSTSTQALLSFACFAAILFISKNLIIAVAAVLLVRIAVMLVYDVPVASALIEHSQANMSAETIAPKFRAAAIRKLIWMTIPLGFVMSLVSLNNNIPRYFIEANHGKAQLGYFTATASFVVAGSMAVSALAQSTLPRLAAYYNENLKAFAKLLVKLGFVGLLIGVAGILVAVVFGKVILRVFFSPDYAENKNVLVVIMVSALPYYISSFINNGLMAARRIKIQIPLHGSSALTVLAGSWLLVPKYGQIGAAWAIFFGAIVTLFGTILVNVIAYRHRKADIAMSLETCTITSQNIYETTEKL
jgi:O-antigen/teichoic acid export membrane protein